MLSRTIALPVIPLATIAAAIAVTLSAPASASGPDEGEHIHYVVNFHDRCKNVSVTLTGEEARKILAKQSAGGLSECHYVRSRSYRHTHGVDRRPPSRPPRR